MTREQNVKSTFAKIKTIISVLKHQKVKIDDYTNPTDPDEVAHDEPPLLNPHYHISSVIRQSFFPSKIIPKI